MFSFREVSDYQVYLNPYYFLPKILLMIKIIIAITATTIKMPTPTPALNIPSIIEQLENDINTIKSINNLVSLFRMILCFKN